MKSSTMPDCSGPGRNSATRAIDIFETAGLQALDEVLHAARFELEHCRGFGAFCKQLSKVALSSSGMRVDIHRRLVPLAPARGD
jgi:hypothetical protein